jgi:hypothetical protein
MEPYKVVRGSGCHIIYTIGLQKAHDVVSLTHRIALYSPETCFIFLSVIHFCYRMSKPQALERPEGLGKLIQLYYHIRSRTRDLQVCSKAP